MNNFKLGQWLWITLLTVALISCADSASEPGSTNVSPGDAIEAAGTPACGCGDRICGFDACGEACGQCDAGLMCYSGTCQDPEQCLVTDATLGEQTAFRMDDRGTERFEYKAKVTAGDFSSIEIISHRDLETVGSLRPGDYHLAVDAITGCDDVCVIARRTCGQAICQYPYIAEVGTLTLDSSAPGNPEFRGSMEGLVFKQAYYDEGTRQYQVLKNADTRCLDQVAFEAVQEELTIEPTDCTPDGTGRGIGDEIADFQMTNCLGETINFHANCGLEALWVVLASDT